MKRSHVILLCALFPAFLGLSSCEKTEMFKTESKIKKQLLGTWNLIPIPKTNPDQTWIYDDNGNVFLTQGAGAQDTGAYEINTTLTKVELKIKDLDNFTDYNATWEVVLLDNDILVMANDHSGATGIKELDFQKRN